MVSSFLASIALFRPVLNAFSPILESGKEAAPFVGLSKNICVKLPQPSNALAPTVVTPLPISAIANLSHLENALLPMD